MKNLSSSPSAERLKSEKGMGLIAVLIAVAIVGILGAVMMALFGTNSDLMFRKNTTRDADNMVRYIQSLLAQPDTCAYALRGGSPSTLLTWNYPADTCFGGANLLAGTTCVEVPNIYVNPKNKYGAAATVAVSEGQALSPTLSVNRIYLRQPIVANGEPAPSTSTLMENWDNAAKLPCTDTTLPNCQATQFNATTAKLVIGFNFTGNVLGGGLQERTIDLRVATLPGTHEVAFCYETGHVKSVDLRCGGTHLYPGQQDCQYALPTNGGQCHVMYFVDGFDALGEPICKCKISCGSDTKNGPNNSTAPTSKLGFTGGN